MDLLRTCLLAHIADTTNMKSRDGRCFAGEELVQLGELATLFSKLWNDKQLPAPGNKSKQLYVEVEFENLFAQFRSSSIITA